MLERLMMCLFLACFSRTALAQEDDPEDSGNQARVTCGSTTLVTPLFGTGSITVSLQNCTSSVLVVIDVASGTYIPRIVFSNSPASGGGRRVSVAVGGDFVTSDTRPSTLAGQDWGGLDTSAVNVPVDLYGGINGDLTDSVTVNEVYCFEAGGAINASLILHAVSSGPNLATIYAGSIGSSGIIRNTDSGSTKNTGKILKVQVAGDVLGASNLTTDPGTGGIFNDSGPIGKIIVGGDLKSYVQARRSSIQSIEVTGNIDVRNGPSDGTLEGISSRAIEKVVAKSITAEINAADTYANVHGETSTPPPGHITLVKTTGGTGTGGAGDLTGNVRFRSLSKVNTGDESGIKIKGTISNNTRVSACITIDPSGTLDQPILIDGTLSGNIYATGTGTAGKLPNQVIINRSNSSKTWSGNVILGSFTLSPSGSQPLLAPYYDKTDSDLGGGAVGLVPFRHPRMRLRRDQSRCGADRSSSLLRTGRARPGNHAGDRR